MKKQNSESISLIFWEKDKNYAKNLCFVVPNMAAFVRDVTEYGNIGAIVRRALKLSIPSLIKMAWWNKFNVFKLLKKDFATGVSILVQMEILQIIKYKPRMIALTDQVTDLAIALQNIVIIKNFLHTITRVGIVGSVVTNNLVDTATTFGRLNIKNCTIITPFNSYGYEMNPSKDQVEKMMRMIDPKNIYAISPVDDIKEDKYLSSFGIQKKVVKWF